MDDVLYYLLTDIGRRLESIEFYLERLDRRFEGVVTDRFKLDKKEGGVAGHQASQEA